MDGPADVGAEHLIDAPVLLDPAEPGEVGRDDGGTEVVAAARQVLYFRARLRYGGLDALLLLVRAGHSDPG